MDCCPRPFADTHIFGHPPRVLPPQRHLRHSSARQRHAPLAVRVSVGIGFAAASRPGHGDTGIRYPHWLRGRHPLATPSTARHHPWNPQADGRHPLRINPVHHRQHPHRASYRHPVRGFARTLDMPVHIRAHLSCHHNNLSHGVILHPYRLHILSLIHISEPTRR